MSHENEVIELGNSGGGFWGDKTKKLPRFLTEPEVHRMFEKAEHSPRDLKVLKILYYFGLRNNEMCTLDVRHIDLKERTLKIIGSDKETGQKGAKGGKDRFIPIIEINPLPDEQTDIVQDLKEWMGNKKSGLLIEGSSENGGISDRHVRRIVKNYAFYAKVPNYDEIHPHTLRHSYATHLKNLGVPLEVIQRILGHENMVTTLIYAHMGIENLRAEVRKYVWIERMRKELPVLMQKIETEQDLQKKLTLQMDFMMKLSMVSLGIAPDEDGKGQ